MGEDAPVVKIEYGSRGGRGRRAWMVKGSGSVNFVARLGVADKAWVILMVCVLDQLTMSFIDCHSTQLQARMS